MIPTFIAVILLILVAFRSTAIDLAAEILFRLRK